MKTIKLVLVLAAAVVAPRLAFADPQTPEEWYREGENQYNLQNFDKAIDAFKKGYELEPSESKKAAYLFNIAQTYKQRNNGTGDCGKAQFYFKRYLDVKDHDTAKPLKPEQRKSTEDTIAALDECSQREAAAAKAAAAAAANANKPVDTKDPKDNGNTTGAKPKHVGTGGAGGEGGEGDDGGDDGSVHKHLREDQPKLVSVRALGGAAKLKTGQITVPVQPTFGILGGYPLPLNDKLTIEVGAGFSATPVPYDKAGTKTTGMLTTAIVNASAVYAVAPKITARVDLGAGGLFFGNVSESSFTMGLPTTGALGMFNVRAGLSADYAVTNNIIVTVAPIAFGYSPAKSGLRSDIKNITTLDFMIGVGYQM